MSIFEKFNEKCESGMDWFFDHFAAFMVLAIVAIIAVVVLAVVYGDGRECLRREPSTYIMQNNVMTPIPGNCIEYTTEFE